MSALLDVILPVFVVLASGYILTWRGYFNDAANNGLMKFAQGFALPLLLFRSISDLDLGDHFNLPLLVSFYAGAIGGFTVGTLGARFLFGRNWEDAVAIGFVGLFSNTLLLGIPITERAYGTDALAANFAIVAIHAPICYFIGITAMEMVRNRGGALYQLPAKIGKAVFSNALIIGISCGFVVNLTGFHMPEILTDGIDLITRAGLPAALVGLGGILYRYRPEGDMRAILFIVTVSLVVHPVIVWAVGRAFGLDVAEFRSAVITAAMAPGVNAYLFAHMYDRAKRVAASAVLIGTGLCIVTAAGWLSILP